MTLKTRVFDGWQVLQLHHKSAKLLVYLLRPGGGEPMRMLRRLIKALETYMHPSNNGYWTRRLSQLLASLCYYFAERIRREKLLPPVPLPSQKSTT